LTGILIALVVFGLYLVIGMAFGWHMLPQRAASLSGLLVQLENRTDKICLSAQRRRPSILGEAHKVG
jgi:hypothetical protein